MPTAVNDRRQRDRQPDQLLLAEPAAQHRRRGVAEKRAGAVGSGSEAVHQRRLARSAQGEREREDEEADRCADRQHPDRRHHHGRLVGLGVLDVVRVTVALSRGRARSTARPAKANSTAPTAQRPLGTGGTRRRQRPRATPIAAVMLENRASRALVATNSSGSSTRVCTSVCLTMPDALLAISRSSTTG
jgi:hypothetical protein